MYCTNCGHELIEGAKFCGNCGYPVEEDILQQLIQPVTDSQSEQNPATEATPQKSVQATSAPVREPASVTQPVPQEGEGRANTNPPAATSTVLGGNGGTILKVAAIIAAVVFAYFAVQGIVSVFISIAFVFIGSNRIAAILALLGNALSFASAALMTAALLLFAFFRTDENAENTYLTVVAAAVIRVLAGALSMILSYISNGISHVYTSVSPFATFFSVLIWAVIAAGVLYALLYVSGNHLFIGKTKNNLTEMIENLPSFITEEFGIVSQRFNSSEKQKSAADQKPPEKMKTNRSIILNLVGIFFTCGIYLLWLYYKMAKDLNTICDGDGSRTGGLRFHIAANILTCGIYEFYWQYCYADRMWKNASRYGIQIGEKGSTILILEIIGLLCCGLGPIIGLILQIRNLNALSRAYNIAVFGEP